MRLSLPVASLFLSTLVASEPLSLFTGGQRVLGDKGEAVPGDNPLTYCNAAHDADLLILDYVNLDPNPPLAGTVLTIEAVGTLLETVGEGAYVNLQVKYGLIKLLTTRADLCEQVSNVDLNCPVEKGKISLIKDVELPQQIPPGTYTVLADAYTVDDKHIVCFEATVKFS
ncbi:putative Phosphatidylglycerol transfer protein [Venustampulla echinocandica]|uniref:Phosphatidylglycerol/phosphatidylinositol transfer protein n=1 Tax=Venustampulla echinocandica TaxID=2656787 RepID=A0A370TFI8_9HELO|nr:putative Phosphatidylglycerol transfer protein [Venustampulla echinocandica]RDL33663.1 putative Phosphatidylglycerol transfer protein [Venustampulla echinocandica]